MPDIETKAIVRTCYEVLISRLASNHFAYCTSGFLGSKLHDMDASNVREGNVQQSSVSVYDRKYKADPNSPSKTRSSCSCSLSVRFIVFAHIVYSSSRPKLYVPEQYRNDARLPAILESEKHICRSRSCCGIVTDADLLYARSSRFYSCSIRTLSSGG